VAHSLPSVLAGNVPLFVRPCQRKNYRRVCNGARLRRGRTSRKTRHFRPSTRSRRKKIAKSDEHWLAPRCAPWPHKADMSGSLDVHKCSKLSVRSATRFVIKAFKTILKGGCFRSAITSDKFISRTCNLFPGIFVGQFPCPSGKIFQIVLVVMTDKVERAAIAYIIKLPSRVAVVIDSSDFVFQRAPLAGSKYIIHSREIPCLCLRGLPGWQCRPITQPQSKTRHFRPLT
jgi:hypothetical protein